MRSEFVACRQRRTAKRRCPWAEFIIKAEGGFVCFQSYDAAKQWLDQK